MKTYKIIAKYYVGYGARMKRLRSVKNQYFKVMAENSKDAEKKVIEKIGRGSLSAGYCLTTSLGRVFSDKFNQI